MSLCNKNSQIEASQHPPGSFSILDIQTEKKHLKSVYFVRVDFKEQLKQLRQGLHSFYGFSNQGQILVLSKKTQHVGFNDLRDVRLLQLHTLSSKQ